MKPLHTARRAAALAMVTMLAATACAFEGVNSLPLPGTVGREDGASIFTVELANVGTLESNSPVLVDDVVVGSIRSIGIAGRHAEVTIRVQRGVEIPANAIATVGQTSLLGSMHLELAPPGGERPAGVLASGATIGLDRSSTYPSTEQTLAALSTVVNAGGLGQIGDVVHSFNDVFTGRQSDIRELLGRLDTFVGVLSAQTADILATITELDRFAATVNAQRDVVSRALRDIPPALEALLRQRPRLIEALDALRRFSDTAATVIHSVETDLVANLAHLEPVFRALSDVGPDIGTGLGYALTFPLNQNIIDRGVRGDYMNLFVTVDLTLGRFKRGLLAGTSFGDENAPLVPAPGDPGYDTFYSKNAQGQAVAPPPGVMGPDRLPTGGG
ncbi:mammalian cell entry protein [Mycolicibacterium duvalii]|uniref:Mammalian cell entry protein n=1 Tax=Mycolicibacterium duvalii TaxID=39688 RepID=A0A7I7K1V3_9MYCO|nr:MCE family protein [Mycolicibacterium duvalii]MCV7370165.1 MCE family protein [Mycolicibacterium duvalii]PEG38482.1 mammalian cell entry protein [Mycolicibacterium duvalii]BBX17471.1 mammalian cell entry protein [Mycolicibacterium duvalii]